MPTVICNSCGKPWVDTEYRFCPHCGAEKDPPGGAPAGSGTAQPALAKGGAMMTRAQGERIVELLEKRSHVRVRVASKAKMASEVLDLLAGLAVGIGIVTVLVGVFAMINGAMLEGVATIMSGAVVAGMSWGLLTALSVVAGYVANQSEA